MASKSKVTKARRKIRDDKKAKARAKKTRKLLRKLESKGLRYKE